MVTDLGTTAITSVGGALKLELGANILYNDTGFGSILHSPSMYVVHNQTGAIVTPSFYLQALFSRTISLSGIGVHTPSAGYNSYTLKFNNDGFSYYMPNSFLVITELKR